MSFGIFKKNELKFWLLSSLVYITLIYSTNLFFAYGPEATITLDYYIDPIDEDLKSVFTDVGACKDFGIGVKSSEFWKLTSLNSDAMYYVLQCESPGESKAPYKYRLLMPTVSGFIGRLTGCDSGSVFVILNILMVFFSSLLFTHFLLSDLKFSRITAFIGGMLFITMVAVTGTTSFPVIESASFFFIILIFIATSRKNIPLFLIASVLGVLTKEILAVSAFVWLFNIRFKKNETGLTLLNVLISLVPLIVFASVRMALGSSPLEVNYGFDILKGEFPAIYFQRLFRPLSLGHLIVRIFLSFGFLWLGLLNINRNAFLFKSSIIIPLTIIFAVLLSGRIIRVLGIVYPVVIPLFLYYIESLAKTEGFPLLNRNNGLEP